VVTYDAEISVVTAQNLAEPDLLLAHQDMNASFHFHPQRLEFSDQALRYRFALHRERTVSQRRAVLREAKKVERLRAPQPIFPTIGDGKTAKPNESHP
jgi:hypothetical protein